jgi:hypothetical protein
VDEVSFKERPEETRKGGPVEFKATYPVIFAALECAFGFMPSNSRLAEQAHGGMRDSLHDGVSLESTDMQRSYIMNEVYYDREERRDCVRARETAAGSTKRRKGGVKHDEFKLEQRKVGEQLLASGAAYDRQGVASLPAEFRKEIGVKRIKDKGILHKDKAVDQQKKERGEAKQGRRTGVPPTLAEFREKAASTIVGNDPLWEDPAIVQRKRDLEKLASMNFWKSLKVKALQEMDRFTNVLMVVLPHLWTKLMAEGVTSTATKIALLKKIGPYLALVSKVANEKVAPDSLLPDDVDISDMNRTDILALFVKQDATSHLLNARAEAKKMHTLRSALISSCGTDINERYLVVPPRVEDVYSDDNDDSDSDDDNLLVDLEHLNDMA